LQTRSNPKPGKTARGAYARVGLDYKVVTRLPKKGYRRRGGGFLLKKPKLKHGNGGAGGKSGRVAGGRKGRTEWADQSYKKKEKENKMELIETRRGGKLLRTGRLVKAGTRSLPEKSGQQIS